MSVLEVQQLLARLYTDPRLLAEFLSDPEAFSARHANGCSDFIQQLDGSQLEFFVESLRSKRAGEVKKLLPMTVQVLGSRFEAEFASYAPTAIPTGEKKHLADAMAFCEHLIRREERVNQHVRESACFELLDCKVRFDLRREGESPVVVRALPGWRPWLRLKRFGCELPTLTGGVEMNKRKNERPRVALFARLPGLRGSWYW